MARSRAGKGGQEEGGAAVMEPPAGAREEFTPAPAIDPDQAPPVQWLHLDEVIESPHNTRKHFDPVRLEELAKSLATTGQTTPVLVRPVKTPGGGLAGYELAAGHRRYRAAKLAGLTHLLAIVREMDDPTFLEILTIENLQREDVHPLEEADGYAQLLLTEPRPGEPRYTPEIIARRVGKSATYVYDTLKLRTLIEPLRELFFAGRFTQSHAIELSRLKPAQQEQAIADWLFEDDYAAQDEDELGIQDERRDPFAGLKPVSVRELKATIRRQVTVSPDDEHVGVLFPEAVREVAQAKAAALPVVLITQEYHRSRIEEGEAPILTANEYKIIGDKGRECDHMALGWVARGPGQGRQTFKICAALDTCTVHWGKEIKAAKAAAAERAKASTATKAKPKENQWEREQRLEREAVARFEPAREAVVTALAAAIKKTSVKPGGALEAVFLKHLSWSGLHVEKKGRVAEAVPRGKTSDDLIRHLTFVLLNPYRSLDVKGFLEAGKALGVDVKKLVDAAQPKATDAKAPAKKAAKKKGGKR